MWVDDVYVFTKRSICHGKKVGDGQNDTFLSLGTKCQLQPGSVEEVPKEN